MQEEPLIGLICDHSSPVLAGDILRSGYRIVRIMADELSPDRVSPVDAWVVDCSDPGRVADATLWLEPRLLALSNRPDPSDRAAYRAWCQRIIDTLDRWTAHLRYPESSGEASRADAVTQLEAVWLLVGSTGAFRSVKRFLGSLVHVPRLAFVYAQHIDPRQQATLEAVGRANNQLNYRLALGRHWLNPGQVLIVPASCQLRFGRKGEVVSSRIPWETPETPSIDTLALAMSGMSPPPAGAIVFSGAGRDGCRGMEALTQVGTKIWAQSPEDCEAPSMPTAAINAGLVSAIGTPEELAGRLTALYPRPAAVSSR